MRGRDHARQLYLRMLVTCSSLLLSTLASFASVQAGTSDQVRSDLGCALRDGRRLAGEIGSAPLHRGSLFKTGLAIGGIAATSLLDESTRDRVQGRLSDRDRRDVRSYGRALSPATWSAAAVGLYAAGWLGAGEGCRALGRESMESFLWAGTATSLLKGVSGRDRPYENEGAFDFRLFRGDTSWPSGHTASAFSVATVLARRAHQRRWKVLAYALAASVAIERVLEDVHWTSDVASGALIGYGVGWSITRQPRESVTR